MLDFSTSLTVLWMLASKLTMSKHHASNKFAKLFSLHCTHHKTPGQHLSIQEMDSFKSTAASRTQSNINLSTEKE
jgi:hypothetical protein